MADYIKIQVPKDSLAGERIQTLLEQERFKNSTQLAMTAINEYFTNLMIHDLQSRKPDSEDDARFREEAMALQLHSLETHGDDAEDGANPNAVKERA